MSAFTKYSDLPAYAEIANLEHELAILKQRRANMVRFAKGVLHVLAIGFAVAVLLLIYAIVADNSDATAKLFLVLFSVTVIGLLAVLVEGTWLGKYLAKPNPFVVGSSAGFHAAFLETAIAGREERLAELKAQQQ